MQTKATVMADSVKVGDKVSWTSSGGKSIGQGRDEADHPDEDQVATRWRHRLTIQNIIVQSEKSGKKAAHKASALKKV